MRIEEEIKQPRFRNDNQKVVVNLMYTANWLTTQQESFFSTFGITPAQYNILRILRGQGGKSLSGADIKSRMLERNSDISRLLDRMSKKKLINRTQCPNDRRAIDVSIAKPGLDVLKEIDGQINQAERQIIHLNREEARQLSNLLDKARG